MIVFFLLFGGAFKYLNPVFLSLFNSPTVSALLILASLIIFYSILQYPFLKVNQTIGKAFCSLKIESTNPNRPLTVSILIQRELFAKIISCFITCVPVFFKKEGWHEIVSETKVVRAARNTAQKELNDDKRL